MIIEAICLLLFFSNLNFKNKFLIRIITFFAPLTFDVYLIHNRVFDILFFYDKKYLYYYIISLKPKFIFLKIYLISILIFIFCAFIDCIRARLFELLKIKYFCLYIENFLVK